LSYDERCHDFTPHFAHQSSYDVCSTGNSLFYSTCKPLSMLELDFNYFYPEMANIKYY